jgi:hypothetical protein
MTSIAQVVDVTFDFRSDTPASGDPDALSPTLRRYHQILWGRALPSGAEFTLDAGRPGHYLYHQSLLGEFTLSSDSIIPTFTRWVRMQPIVSQISEEENEAFLAIAYTIGGMMIWPCNPVDRQRTINVERGFNQRIADRMDLTLECIRRHYIGRPSPMAATLERYAEFFALFGDFPGFVDHFFLQDLTTADRSEVVFFMSFDDFLPPAVPPDLVTYREYRRRSIDFITARNLRIDEAISRPGEALGQSLAG